MQEHEKRCAKVRLPAVADRSAYGRVSRGRSSLADELVVHHFTVRWASLEPWLATWQQLATGWQPLATDWQLTGNLAT